jgi:hypothetical protein
MRKINKKEKKSPRPPERSYANRPLLDKLGVKPESRIAVIGVRDASFLAQLAGRAADVARGWPKKDSDLIFFDAKSAKDLEELHSLRGSLKPDGAIWVVYPKGRPEIREIVVIAGAKRAGLVDNKVVRFSETHTALKLVIPLANR